MGLAPRWWDGTQAAKPQAAHGRAEQAEVKPTGWAKDAFEAGRKAALSCTGKDANPYTRTSYKQHGPQKSAWWQAGYDSVNNKPEMNGTPCPAHGP